MSLETLTFVAVVLGLAATVFYGELGRRSQVEQLRLAREQASKEPDLVVTDARLVDVDQVDEAWNLVREVENEREQERRRKAEYQAELRRLESLEPIFRSIRRHEIERDFYSPPDLFRYEGSLPDKVLLVDLANQGGSTAFEVSGGIHLESFRVEFLPHFSSGGDDLGVSIQDGIYRIEVGETKRIMLTPCTTYSIVLAVRRLGSGRTTVYYDLSSPVGSPASGSLELQL